MAARGLSVGDIGAAIERETAAAAGGKPGSPIPAQAGGEGDRAAAAAVARFEDLS